MDEKLIELLLGHLNSKNRIAVLTGAGISAESGVPTFRGGGGAPVWRNFFDPTKLSNIKMLSKDLKIVWEWFEYRRDLISKCDPNDAHKWLAEIQKSLGSRYTLITQNVDGLHLKAGSTDIIELHGNLWWARGMKCSHVEALWETPLPELPPLCSTCHGPLRPRVVLFGETLIPEDIDRAIDAVSNCELMLVIGTSAEVYPAASFPKYAKAAGARVVEINPTPTGLNGLADDIIPMAAGDFVRALKARA